MPNWAINRLILSGPTAEIQRFQTTCIRPQRGDDLGEINLDFEAIIPMPPAILATLDDRSSAASDRARAATGFDDWFDWRLVSWGTKWNASELAILNAEPDLLDLTFDTAWNSPEPIFRALAEQYPQLKGYALGTDPAMDWSLFGILADGAYSSSCLEAAALSFLILDCTLTPVLSETSARVLAQNWANITAGSRSAGTASHLAANAAALVKAALPADAVARFDFVEHHACADYLADCDSDVIGSSAAADLAFLSAQDRSRTGLDRDLMEELARQVREEALYGFCPSTDPSSFASQAAELAQCCSEEELRAWAAAAMFRPGISLDMSDSSTLQAGFIAYAARLYSEAVAHLGRRATALAPPAPAAAGLGG